jgi:hypothetical protein
MTSPSPMQAFAALSRFWTVWLTAACCIVMLAGLIMMAMPGLTREGFGLLLYADRQYLTELGAGAVDYM